MNRLVSFLMAVLATVAMSNSCLQNEAIESNEEELAASMLEAPEFEEGFTTTKVVLVEGDQYTNGVNFVWGPSESIGVYGTRLTNSKYVSANKYSTDGDPVFKGGSLFSSAKYAYYPYSTVNNSKSYTNVEGTVPQVQTFSTIHKKMTTDYKIGKVASSTYTGYRFSFTHVLNMIRYKVNATGTALEGDKLYSVTLTVNSATGEPRQLWGDFVMDISKDYQSAIKSWSQPSADMNTIKLNVEDEPVLKSGTTVTGYLTAAPTSAVGDLMTLVIRTDKHIATINVVSKAAFAPNKIINYPLTLANLNMTVENLPDPEEPGTPDVPEEPEIPAVHPVISSFSFTVADNPGKILGRRLVFRNNATSYDNVTVENCVVDTTNHTVSLYLPYLNNRTLVPTFDIPEGTSLYYDDVQILSGQTAVDFHAHPQISVVNEAGDAEIYTVNLTNTGLPVVVVNQETGTTNRETDSEYSKASTAWYNATGAKWLPKTADWQMTEGVDNFMVYNSDGTSAVVNKNGAVVNTPILASTRLRGNVTQQMPKKSFAVKLDAKSGVLGMAAHKRWVLLANWKDRTLLRNTVAFDMAKIFENTLEGGIEWNPTGQHVELIYNGVHVGTYFLCEQIKIDKNRLNINEPYDAEDAYSGNPADYGFLLECDDAYDESWKFTSRHYVPFLFKDDGNDAMVDYAKNIVYGVEENLYAGYQGTQSRFTTAFQTLDITSTVDFLLLQEIMMNSEMKHPKSCYMYINNGKLYAGPIWDFDWNTLPTSTSYSEEGYSYTASMLAKSKHYRKRSGYPTSPMSDSDANYMWYPMLVKSTAFKDTAKSRWDAVKGLLINYVDVEIPKIQAKIALSESENYKMWRVQTTRYSYGNPYGIGGGVCGDEQMSFSQSVSTLQSTLKKRINGMSYVSNKSWPNVTISNR